MEKGEDLVLVLDICNNERPCQALKSAFHFPLREIRFVTK